jgi:phosphonate transport system substrate-binding protein
MKKLGLVLLALSATALAACGGVSETKKTLSVFFVPSRDNAVLVQGISYLPELLKAELSELGYDLKVSVFVGTSYEAVGEALDSGTADVGFIPGGTYAVYSDGKNMLPALTATRGGLNKDSANPKDWNDGLPTTGNPLNQVGYYRSLGIVGTSPKGRELAAIVNSGGQITWEQLQTVKIGVQGPTSSAGRIYPSLLFSELYNGKTLDDIPSENLIPMGTGGYGAAAAALASGQVDLAFGYADIRRDYATNWTTTYNRTESIWAETDVVFVTDGIYNDTITVSKSTVDDDLEEAIAQAFINLVGDDTPLAKPSLLNQTTQEYYFAVVSDVFKVYSHEGYIRAKDSDYDGARAANALIGL